MHTHSLYGPVVHEKNWVPAPSFLMRRQRILKSIAQLPRGNTLEVGCGSGTLLYELNKKGFICQGLESSEEAFDTASYVNGDTSTIHKTPQNEWVESFDYLLAMEVLEHIEDDRQALDLWRSWLRPNGKLLLSVPAHASMWTEADVWAGHYRRYEKPDLLQLIQCSGFRIDKFECWGFPLSNLLLTWRAKANKEEMEERRNGEDNRKLGNAQSGVNRSATVKLFPYMDCWPGQLAMRVAFLAQAMTINRDWGVGYLLVATKIEE